VRVVGTEKERIGAQASLLLDNRDEYERMARAINPYGDAKASPRIVAALLGEPVEPFVPRECVA